MNQSATATYVVNTVGNIDGIVSCMLADRDSEPATPMEYPAAFVYADEPQDDDFSLGPSGTVQSTYAIEIMVLLGTPDLLSPDVEALKLLLADRFRATFWQDRTLGGNCWDCRLSTGTNNVRNYRDLNDYPQLTRRLTVIEHTVKSAAQSG